MNRQSNRRVARNRARSHAAGYGVPTERGPISPRAVMLLLLAGGPVLLICLAFFFGVGMQALGLVSAAKQGSVLGGVGGAALTVLVAAFFCVPGYAVAVIWFGVKSKWFADDIDRLKKQTLSIPLVALLFDGEKHVFSGQSCHFNILCALQQLRSHSTRKSA